jgi:Lanthionine synthetase C-like protein
MRGLGSGVLYRADAFEPLTDEPWEEAGVGGAIRELAADAQQGFDPERLWPAADDDREGTRLPLNSIYLGAAGVIWALGRLSRRGHVEVGLDLTGAARSALDAWRSEPDLVSGDPSPLPSTADAGLFFGETGLLLVAWQLAPSGELADGLHKRVLANRDSEANELMWGAPGTMLAARAMLDWTGEPRWAEAWRESAESLYRQREPDGLWTQRLYGRVQRSLGSIHGAVGNVLALLSGDDLLAAERRVTLERETAAALARAAVVEDGLANWPPTAGGGLAAPDGQIRVQWCHGAPGIVASAADYLDEELLLAGAELTWRAGPLKKGPGLCHGTAGNGYALLKAFERTADELWLERARKFAVHALEQARRARHERRHGRYSLWTGDLGAAVFAADCIDRRTAMPAIDTWD